MDNLRLLIIGFVLIQGSRGQRGSQCDISSCYPATGDLLIGRETNLTATSTCGIRDPERYCIVSHLEEEKKCFQCDSRDLDRRGPYNHLLAARDMSHRIDNIVTSYRQQDSRRRWWQAENGRENVSIQLNLEAEFHFTHLVMRFKTFRPSALFVERSHDWGKTWKTYRYFAYDCAKSFPGVAEGPIRDINDVICESRYSDVAPSSGGEVIFRVLPPNIEIPDPYTQEVQDLLKMTNLRVNFTELHTLGDDLLDNRDEIKEKYYYAIYEMIVRGSCSCYGHASRCKPIQGHPVQDNMVYGECECAHNTEGLNCEVCMPFYNDIPWKPAHRDDINACKKCNCNNHSDRCHFDPSVYESSGRVSGGVCDGCEHNTKGQNCQACEPRFYQDPNRDVTDPYFCRQCLCDPDGSMNDGECTSHTDFDNGLVAGACLCKRYVEGDRCDRCLNGYWNMDQDNADGCTACTCNHIGIIDDQGCDVQTGNCRCKRYVTNRDCDMCLPQYWGLSVDDPEGCKPCECDVGGAYNNDCEQQHGQCSCRPHIVGRKCDTVEPGYFVPGLDYYTYEAEDDIKVTTTGRVQVVIRELDQFRDPSWTGPGFVKVTEGDSVEFTIDNLPYSMEYDIIIRYEPQMPDRWEDVRVTVVRPAVTDRDGPCANIIPQDDFKATSLPQGERYYKVSPPSCFEARQTYTIRIDFNRYKSDRTTPEASVLIDSVLILPRAISLIPRIRELGGEIPDRMLEEFERYGCREQQYPVLKQDMSEVCKRYIFSITAIIEDTALACECDNTGSTSSQCDNVGGKCHCKPNVVGRRCDQCAPGTWGFGPAGCIACECSDIGAFDNFCDPQSGQCECRHGVYGRQCNECQRGYWSFPQCRLCECNGLADECDDNGVCRDCKDNTGGVSCDRCADGYYGDARPGALIGCRPCMCPGGAGSGFQHGDTCSIDVYTNLVTCNCGLGYRGDRCDQCEENYYGNPMQAGGECTSCAGMHCNNNIDMSAPGSCDAGTGECLRCQYHTEGFNCDVCEAGFYGDATIQDCIECVCFILGHDRSSGHCDIYTGQCPCLPNVVGIQCDQCADDHWKIASGEGCDACACDPDGSLSTQCNQFDGQCPCRPGRGGRDCGECEANHWGDPDIQCHTCDCLMVGSETQQCDHRTGKCECIPGIGGHKCDRCDRGTTGEIPNCKPCGECFDNWDRELENLRNETAALVEEGRAIKTDGAPGAFRAEFKQMEEKLDEVRRILAGANITDSDLARLEGQLNVIRTNLTEGQDLVESVESDLTDTTIRIESSYNKIEAVKKRIESLKRAAEDLKNNATSIKELDVAGAYNSTKQSGRRSLEAQHKVDNTESIVQQSATTRDNTEALITNQQDRFDEQYHQNEKDIHDIDIQLERLDEKITGLNTMVCDGAGEPCDLRCGGAGCGKCGGASCDEGAVTKSANALDFAKRADETLRAKSKEATALLEDLRSAQEVADSAKSEAQMAYDLAMSAKNESETSKAELQDLLNRMKVFLEQQGASPADIRSVATEVLAMSISLTPQEIMAKAREIEDTIAGLTDIDSILDATRDDLNTAGRLKTRADTAKAAADAILSTAQRVLGALDEAEEAQNKASDAIDQAKFDIENAEGDLTQIESEVESARQVAGDTLGTVNTLKEEASELKRKFLENDERVMRAETEADLAEVQAKQAELDAVDLENKYKEASDSLGAKYNETKVTKDRADGLRDRASRLYQEQYEKLERLKGMETEFTQNEKLLTDLSTQIEALSTQMVRYLSDITTISQFHRSCQR